MKYAIVLFVVASSLIDPVPGSQELPKHDVWHSLLQAYVNKSGIVNYAGFRQQEQHLQAYLSYLGKHPPKEHWSHEAKLAYYINLYNAGTVALILEYYPVNSIKDIKRPWGKNRLQVGKDSLSLGKIENEILRKMHEPRIHFAINCASYSCPKLRNEAYTAARLEEQLQEATIDFINDPAKNVLSPNRAALSPIFKWFKADFTEKGSLIEFLRPYTKVALTSNTKISYQPYDWSLNEIGK